MIGLLVVAAAIGGVYVGIRTTPWPAGAMGPVSKRAQIRKTSIMTLGAELAGLPLFAAAVYLGLSVIVLVVYVAAVFLAGAGVLAVLLMTNRTADGR